MVVDMKKEKEEGEGPGAKGDATDSKPAATKININKGRNKKCIKLVMKLNQVIKHR